MPTRPTGQPDASEPIGLKAAWAALVRAANAARLYDLDHPQVAARLEEAAACTAGGGLPFPLTLLVEPDRLVPLSAAAAEAAPEASAEARLASLLHGFDVGALRLAEPPRPADLAALISALAASPVGRGWTRPLEAVSERTGGRLRLDPLDLGILTAGPEGAADAAGTVVNWASLVQQLVPDPASAGGSPVEAAAAAVAERIAEDPELGSRLLAQRLTEADERLNARGGPEARAGRERMRGFAAELGRLLEEESPDGTAARLPRDRPTGSSGSLQSRLLCEALSNFQPEHQDGGIGAAENWTAAVRDLLEARGTAGHTPEAYLRRLETLAARQDAALRQAAAAPPGPVDPARFGARPVSEHLEAVVLDMALMPAPPVAVEAAGRNAGPEASLLGHLATRLGPMVERHDAEALLRVHAALGRCADEAAGLPLREAWMEWVDTPDFGAALAERSARSCSDDRAAAKSLLAAAGPEALRGFLTAAGRRPAHAAALLRLVERDRLGPLGADWTRANPAAACGLVRALAPLSFDEARGLLASELVQRDPARRVAAFATLLDASDATPPEFCVAMLSDPDASVLRLGVAGVLAGGTQTGVDRLLGWLTTQHPRRSRSLPRVLRSLLDDEQGRGLLHHLLRVDPAAGVRMSRLRFVAASTLADHPDLTPALAAAVAAAGSPPNRGLSWTRRAARAALRRPAA